jgi:cathepsin B
MKLIVVVLAIWAVAALALTEAELDAPLMNDDIIRAVNENSESTWVSGYSKRFEGYTVREFVQLLGTYPEDDGMKVAGVYLGIRAVPDQWDARKQWPVCTSISEIRDQGKCGSCWAFGAVEALSDRFCVATGKNVRLSAEDLTSCQGGATGDGCRGGYPSSAWSYMRGTGVVTEECYPYEIPPCVHPCGEPVHAPKCKSKCTNGTAEFHKDKHFASTTYSVGGSHYQEELMKAGPFEVSFAVYNDFPTYKSGVYQHKSGSLLGYHAVKIIGWGVENGTPYWTIANSWNTIWGDLGYFKILRGRNECGIEGGGAAGLPKV